MAINLAYDGITQKCWCLVRSVYEYSSSPFTEHYLESCVIPILKVCPALAMGNVVVLKPASFTRLTALLFAEICAEAGLPEGVFNVVTGPGSFGEALATHPLVDKVAFTGMCDCVCV